MKPETATLLVKLIWPITLLLAIIAFGLFIWPTPYEYTRKYPNVVRVNRFTGEKETSGRGGWISR